MTHRFFVVLLAVVLLAGCAAAPVDRLSLRLGLVPPLPAQTIEPAAQVEMKRHYDAGADALGRNDLEGAVAAWNLYSQAVPFQTPETRAVRGYLTLLEREIARRYARQAVERERAGAGMKTNRQHVALLPFQNRGDAPGANKPFNRAIMAMIATDLAQVPSLKVLERQRIDTLMQEIKLSDSGLIDRDTAVRGGRLLGAGTVIIGSVYNGAPPDQVYTGEAKYTISATVSDVERGGLIGVQEAYGQAREFLELEKQIVHGILDTLGVTEIPAAVDKVHTRSWDAYANFTLGLKFLAEDRFGEARSAFQLALRFDPNFTLAEAFHLATPERVLTLEQIQVEARARR